MRKLLFVLLAVFSPLIFADDLIVTVTPPAVWSNGDVVAPGDVAQYEITVDCSGNVATVLTDQVTHTFLDVAAGTCSITGMAIDQGGVKGAIAQVSAVTGNSLGAPSVAVVVDTGGNLVDVLAACTASPDCIVITGQ